MPKDFFHTASPFRPKFRGVPFGVICWVCEERTSQAKSVKLLSKYSNLCDHDTERRTDERFAVAIPRSAQHRAAS